MNEQAARSYRELMLEVKYRTEAIDDILGQRVRARARIAEEYCYLQLRLICETIALACLVAHGEVSAKKKDLLKSYKADWIMNQLERLHPEFYPVALEGKDEPGNPPAWIHKTEGFLTKRELVDLYIRAANDRLHRGSVRNLLKRDNPNLAGIQVWRDKVVGLLTRHILTSPDADKILYCAMNDGQDRVATNTFEKVDRVP